VNFVPGFRKREFYLVASFGRANFKHDIHTVSLALQACFGGVDAQFHVKLLQTRVFRFSVSTRAVGFEIYNSGKFSEKDFDLFDHLWGNGGPNWLFEEKKYYKEQDSEWNLVMPKKRTVFERLSRPKSPKHSVFERLVFPPANINSINARGNGLMAGSYAEAVSRPFNSPVNYPLNSSEHSNGKNHSALQFKRKNPVLPRLLPFMQYSTFKAPDANNWPKDSFPNWFKAHGPVLEAITARSFKELFTLSPLLSSVSLQFVPPSFTATVNPRIAFAQSPSSLPLSHAEKVDMANIPINPEPFVPNGFEILHVEGRTVVHRVVLPRRGRKHEDFAIATITPMPPGQVLFANVRDVLMDFLASVGGGFKSVQKCPFGQAYVQVAHLRDRDMLVNNSPHVFGDISISFTKHNEGINWRRTHLNIECWILLVGPPLDNWSTEDVTAIVCKFGRLIIWENDANYKGRILAKVRCSELREIPKSVRLTDGEHVDTESWTFSIEVLSQNPIVGPPEEDPIPVDGADAHPFPIVAAPVLQNNAPLVGNDQDQQMVPAAIDNAGNLNQNEANQNFGNNAFQGLLNAMEVAGDLPDLAAEINAAENNALDGNSSITLSVPISDGDHSHNGPNIINEEVNQEQDIQIPVDPLELELLEAPLNIDDFVQAEGPVIVHGPDQGLNVENFQQLGIGVQNLMMAYHDIDSDSESEASDENSPMQEDNRQENQNQNLEYFHFNEVVPAEVAHLQLGLVETFMFPLEDMSKFSKEGLELWDKYFAPNIQKDSVQSNQKTFEIPVSWFNFITLMLLTPEKFDWTKKFLNSSLWKILLDNDSKENTIYFLIPDTCSVNQAPPCKIAELDISSEEKEGMSNHVPPSAPKRKRRGKGPLVEMR
jgi:hypothetical protein